MLTACIIHGESIVDILSSNSDVFPFGSRTLNFMTHTKLLVEGLSLRTFQFSIEFCTFEAWIVSTKTTREEDDERM